MEKYILELLKGQTRVIVPDLGAFIVSYGKETTIIFNSFLTFNDGVLIGHISNEEGIDTSVAGKKVEAFVSKIKKTLERGDSFVIDDLGVFSKDISGNLKFSQVKPETSKSKTSKPDSAAVVTPPTPKPDRSEAETKSDLLVESNDELLDIVAGDDMKTPTVVKDSPKISLTDPFAPIEKPETKTVQAPTISQVSQVTSTSQVPDTPSVTPISPILPENKTDVQPKPAEESAPVPYDDDYDSEDTNRRFPIWLPILIISVLLLLGCGYFFFLEGRFSLPFLKKKTPVIIEQIIEEPEIEEPPQIEIIEEPIIEEPAVNEPIKEPIKEPAKVEPTPSGTRHHIIIGCFQELPRAEKLVADMQNKGYKQATMFLRKGLHCVSVENHSSADKAAERQEELLNELKMDNWVLPMK